MKKELLIKRLTIMLLALFLISCGSEIKYMQYIPDAPAPQYIEWFDFNYVLIDKAKEENKIMFVFMYSPTCNLCTKMNKVTFKDERVIKLLSEHFVATKTNIDKFPQSLDLIRSKKDVVTAYLFLRPNDDNKTGHNTDITGYFFS